MSPRRLIAALSPLLLLARPAPAHACGGMIFPAHSERVFGMSDQELLVVFAEAETVLVASAGYQDVSAADLAFVLPLAAAPTDVRDADRALFVALDERSAPRVDIFVDDGGGGGGGCAADGGGKGFGDGDVMVLQRGATATYEWVVVGGDTGTAIAAWLGDAGYTLPADYAAAFDRYVADDWFFFAAKVRPDVQTAALSPIELHLPPEQPETFEIPLGIAAYSLPPGEPLRITTYLWAGGPVRPADDEARAVDDADLIARSEDETNYPVLEREILDQGAWLIDFSDAVAVADLQAAYAEGVDAGLVKFEEGAPKAIDDFFERSGQSGGHLTRLRAELRPEKLHDLALRRDPDLAVDNVHRAVLDQRPAGACAFETRGRLLDLLLLGGALLWLRPRRRTSARTS